jgi:hypothetical protein
MLLGAGVFLIAYVVSPFWLSIVLMVAVLSLVAYILLAMLYDTVAKLVRFLSIAYTSSGGGRNGENDD